MKLYTVEDVMAARPCLDYPESRLRELCGERDGLTAREIAALPIPVADRLWVLVFVVLGDRERRLLAVRCAREALGRVGNPDPRSVAACDVAERYANGQASAVELANAWETARDAARDASLDAARDSKRVAACNAAWVAACNAAWAAACNAARDAVWDAARHAAMTDATGSAFERYLGWALEAAEESE